MSNQVANEMARKKAEDLLSPLLEAEARPDDDGSAASAATNELEQRTPLQKLKTLAVLGGFAAGAAASVAAIVLAPAVVTGVMGAICIANVPYAVHKERKIGALPSLRALNGRLSERAREIEEEVEALDAEIDALMPNAERAMELERELRSFAAAHGVDADRLVGLVKENEDVLARMRDNLCQRVLQDVIYIVMRSDHDKTWFINQREAGPLALRIQIQLQEYRVRFDSDKFVQVVGEGATVQAVITLLMKLLPVEVWGAAAGGNEDEEEADEEPEDSESDIEEDSVYDMFHVAEEDAGTGAEGASHVSLVCESRRRWKKHSSRRPNVSKRAQKSPPCPEEKPPSGGAVADEAGDAAADGSPRRRLRGTRLWRPSSVGTVRRTVRRTLKGGLSKLPDPRPWRPGRGAAEDSG